jgi:hypothetical protein
MYHTYPGEKSNHFHVAKSQGSKRWDNVEIDGETEFPPGTAREICDKLNSGKTLQDIERDL